MRAIGSPPLHACLSVPSRRPLFPRNPSQTDKESFLPGFPSELGTRSKRQRQAWDAMENIRFQLKEDDLKRDPVDVFALLEKLGEG